MQCLIHRFVLFLYNSLKNLKKSINSALQFVPIKSHGKFKKKKFTQIEKCSSSMFFMAILDNGSEYFSKNPFVVKLSLELSYVMKASYWSMDRTCMILEKCTKYQRLSILHYYQLTICSFISRHYMINNLFLSMNFLSGRRY